MEKAYPRAGQAMLETFFPGKLSPKEQERWEELRQLADATLPSVDAVADLLCQVFERLRSSATMDTRVPTLGRETHGEGCSRD